MPQYCMLIQWDGEAFSVYFPEFPGRQTQGTSWQDAAKNGEELLAQILESGEQPVRQSNINEQLEAIDREIDELGKILKSL